MAKDDTSQKNNKAKAKAKASGSVLEKCNCKSDFQDKRYGPQRRVHNVTTKGVRCTVCGSEKA